MEDQARSQLLTGAVLVFLGIVLLALQFTAGFGDSVLFFLIGGLFVAGYLYRRAYGLLIPGGILLGLGLGSVGESTRLAFGDLESIGLGLGFVSIFVIDLVYRGKTHWWPLVPGLILIVTGLASGNVAFERLLSVGWPLILIAIGLLVLVGSAGFRSRRNGN